MSTHTRGSWYVDAPGDGLRILSDHGTIVCNVSGAMTNPSVIADANLISAAPELLDALQQMLYWSESRTPCGDPSLQELVRAQAAARAAIAKATGAT